MLHDPKITSFVPTINPELSKQFYSKTLGLHLITEDQYALEFEGRGSVLRITVVGEFKPHPFAVLGFSVENIDTEVKALKEKEVLFERYGSLAQDDLGVWTSPSGARIAWFKDPDGNLLSLTQYP